MKKKKFVPNAPEHIYQRAADHGVIFYRIEDYLVFFTIISIISKKNGVSILSLCFMINHIHLLISSPCSKARSRAIDEYTSMFSKQFNHSLRRKGALFEKEFGRAMKIGEKKVRTCEAYLANNPVEKCICISAIEYRWNFLAYYNNNHPFSEGIVNGRRSKWMKVAMATVDRVYDDENYMRYEVLEFILKHLNPKEKEQIVDYIITKYNFIDYENAISYFGDYDKMISAFNFNTGGEYDIHEDWDSDSDQAFAPMLDYIKGRGLLNKDSINIFNLEEPGIRKLVQELALYTPAKSSHIHKLLHIPMNQVSLFLQTDV
ncbi:MAG: transposase [Bacteroidales bacterium]|nr:transposase [Bacteroidales bacterium]